MFLSLNVGLILQNSSYSDEMLHNVVFYLGFHRFHMYPSGSSGLQRVQQQSRKTCFYEKKAYFRLNFLLKCKF